MKNLILLLCSILAFIAPTAIAKPEKKVKDPNISPPRELILKFERREPVKADLPERKYLQDGGVLELFSGDKVNLEFDKVEGELKNPKVVTKVVNPKQTITFEFTQDKKISILNRSTKITATVAMDCDHLTLGSKDFQRTNLYPTEKGLSSFDSWPNSVYVLRLSNIEVTAKSASKVYKEKVGK